MRYIFRFLFIQPIVAFDHLLEAFFLLLLPSNAIKFLRNSGVVLRNRAALEEIDRILFAKKESLILDVGASSEGIYSFQQKVPGSIILLDIDYQSLAAAKRKGIQKIVLADGCNLPFKDDSINISVSIHSLEHIPRIRRTLFTSELKRVSRDAVVIVAPLGKEAERVAKRFVRNISFLMSAQPRLPLEHLECGIPTIEEVNDLFQNPTIKYRRNSNVDIIILTLSWIPGLRWLSGIFYYIFLRGLDHRPPFCEVVVIWNK